MVAVTPRKSGNMIIVSNKFTSWLLGKRYAAMCLVPFLLVAPGVDLTTDAVTLNHEKIHARQQIEMVWLFFFLWYFLEYLVRFILYRSHVRAYLNLSHEREAYAHAADLGYLETRRPFAWFRFLFHPSV